MDDLAWDLSRSTGIVATVLMVAALAWGFLFSARDTGSRRRPAWWLDLHNWLGGASLVFTVAHLATVYLDSTSGIGVAELLVPGAATADRLALAWGVIAFYLLTTTVLTSWPRRLFGRRTWRVLHLGSVIGLVLALVHGLQMGTDGTTSWYRAVVLALVAAATYTLGVRVIGLWVGHRSGPQRRHPANSQPPHRQSSV